MTEHPEFISLIVRTADGVALDAPDQARLDQHLAACPACREALAAQTSVRALLQRRPADRAPVDFAQRIHSAIAAPAPWTSAVDFRRWTWRLAPVAAALAIGAFGLAPRAQVDTAPAPTVAVVQVPDSTALVSSALWSDSLSDTSVLSLMLRANADDPLADHLNNNKLKD